MLIRSAKELLAYRKAYELAMLIFSRDHAVFQRRNATR